jgi:p-hydroxybenzoate 3-monooxygenase
VVQIFAPTNNIKIMNSRIEKTKVAIIGAGVSGLTLATFLQKSGIDCIILERRNRSYIEMRQRAGVVEGRGVEMFERWGLADKLLGGPLAQTIDYRVNGSSRLFTISDEGGAQSKFCTQQMLVNNLLRELIDVMGGEVRFDVTDLTIINEENETPKIIYSDKDGSHKLSCDYIVGCDGDKGVSRASIPKGVLTKYSHEYGYAWLAALVEAPVTGNAIMAVSDNGFVGQLPRGPQRSRYYLQCALKDGIDDWSDERLWDEIRLRLCDNTIENVQVHDKTFVPLRSVVYAPMQYNNLFLAGDAAHLVPPASAKGMNLSLFDVDILAQSFLHALNDNDYSALQEYSATVLPRIWKYQDFALWMTDTMHNAGDPTQHGTFHQMVARARLDTLFSSPLAARLHGDYQLGKV